MLVDTVKVLIADNNPSSCSFMTGTLERAGYFEVIAASDENEGLSKVFEEHPQCLILNFALPGMSGCDLCRRLRANGSTLPIILVSVNNTVVERNWSLLQGADRFLPMPLTAETLVQSVREVLSDLCPHITSKQFTANPLRVADQYQTMHLVTVIRELQLGRKSGMLTLRRGEWTNTEEAIIKFVNGQITEACAGRRRGAEARNWISGWGTCCFTFVPSEKD